MLIIYTLGDSIMMIHFALSAYINCKVDMYDARNSNMVWTMDILIVI